MIGFLLGLNPRIWAGIAATLFIGALIAFVALWVHNMRHAVTVAQGQRNVAVVSFVRSEIDLVTARVNEAVLSDAISVQNHAIQVQGQRSAQALSEAATGLARAQAVHRSDEARLAVLRRPLAAPTACGRADEAARRAREALR